MASSSGLWVFGYGSLVWKPGFEYEERVLGHIEDHARVFWQGNTTHRGVPGKPGRVATLVKHKEAITHGVAFRVVGQAAMGYLNQREAVLGGYTVDTVPFFPSDNQEPLLKEDIKACNNALGCGPKCRRTPRPQPPKGSIHVLLYVATEQSEHWLGESSEEEIAEQVVNSSGDSGHNVEYVLKLADWMKAKLPDVHDPHLFTLEELIRAKVDERKLNMRKLMGEESEEEAESEDERSEASESTGSDGESIAANADAQQAHLAQVAAAQADGPKGGFASVVPHKCLRCVKL